MIRLLIFFIFYGSQFCQGLATVNSKTYFKPDLKRKESRLTGCQILVLKESASTKTLNNPFLRRGLEFSKNTKVVKNIKVSAKWSLCQQKRKKTSKISKITTG